MKLIKYFNGILAVFMHTVSTNFKPKLFHVNFPELLAYVFF